MVRAVMIPKEYLKLEAFCHYYMDYLPHVYEEEEPKQAFRDKSNLH
jgi:Lon protease-like protein